MTSLVDFGWTRKSVTNPFFGSLTIPIFKTMVKNKKNMQSNG